MSAKASFQAIDYVIFSIVLAVSAFIGLYFGIKRQFHSGRKPFKSTPTTGAATERNGSELNEYLTANSSMSTFNSMLT
jgi:hypothetical protein